jgi:biopolymer transport protein ExbD
MRRRWRRRANPDPQTVDLTGFLSLLVILVPFLLVTAVFTRTTILEVQTAGQESGEGDRDDLALRVIIRTDAIEVSYADSESPDIIERGAGDQPLQALAELAGRLKASHPQSEHATVLVEPQIPYELLVQVLDTLRLRLGRSGDTPTPEFLFPRIALGPAPASPGEVGSSR